MSDPHATAIGAAAVMEDPEEAPQRIPVGWPGRLTQAIGLVLALFVLATAAFGSLPTLQQRAVFVGLAGVLVFALIPAGRRNRGPGIPWYDWILMVLTIAATAYVAIDQDRIMRSVGLVETQDVVMGSIMLLLVLEMSRRVIGYSFLVMLLIFVAYTFLGQFSPLWPHRGFNYGYIIETLYMGPNGIWGSITGIVATVVPMFVIFGAVIFLTGGGATFIDIAIWLAGSTKGGPAKVATVGSGLFGMISGSSAANVSTVGSLTIPLMRRLGYPPVIAGAVEAAASTGGLIMPPVMGAGAFIMAELIGVPYGAIAIAAIIPALLYYFGIIVTVHFLAQKLDLRPMPRSEIPKARVVFHWRRSAPLLVPVGLLIYFLLTGWTPTFAGFTASLAAVVLYLIAGVQGGLPMLRERSQTIVRALIASGIGLTQLAALAVGSQLAIAPLGLTGLGVKFSEAMLQFSGGELLPTMLVTAFLTLVLGLGLASIADYLIAVAVVGPLFATLGATPLATHLFIFYWACLAGLTPPVAGTAVIAAGMAGANWVKTAWWSCRLAIAAFIAPFLFVVSPGILMQGNPVEIALSAVQPVLGITAFAAGTVGYLTRRLKRYEQALLMIGAILLLWPNLGTALAGAAIVVAVYFWQRRVRTSVVPPIGAA